MSSGNEREIIAEFQQRRQRLMDLVRKVEELSNEASEHEIVIKALEPMEANRKCFRLIGDVLVERTVGETLPAVTKNKENLEAAISTLSKTCQEMENQLSEFQTKHKIKFVNRQGQPIEEEDEGRGAGSSKAQGVLVKK